MGTEERLFDDSLWDAIAYALDAFTPTECQYYLAAAGYVLRRGGPDPVAMSKRALLVMVVIKGSCQLCRSVGKMELAMTCRCVRTSK